MPDALPEELEAALAASAGRRGPFGTPAIFHVETGSTNDDAAVLAERGAPEGAAVVSDAQRAGRGRRGREWFSPAGAGLYFSIVCRNARTFPFLTLAGGVAAADGIRAASGLPVTIKWPNDIVVADRAAPGRQRKLAGILAEASTAPGGVPYVVLGFGINVRAAQYPAEVAARATSIEAELGRRVNAGAVLAETLACLNGQVEMLADGRHEPLLERWRALAPSVVGSAVEWRAAGVTRRGVTTGIDRDGALLVRVGARVERIIAGELCWR
jgi:BirA family biotin operon repressor/biotin-[acetyl-CoA-carboxylase] ligase